jgi:hypothetical protein
MRSFELFHLRMQKMKHGTYDKLDKIVSSVIALTPVFTCWAAILFARSLITQFC